VCTINSNIKCSHAGGNVVLEMKFVQRFKYLINKKSTRLSKLTDPQKRHDLE